MVGPSWPPVWVAVEEEASMPRAMVWYAGQRFGLDVETCLFEDPAAEARRGGLPPELQDTGVVRS